MKIMHLELATTRRNRKNQEAPTKVSCINNYIKILLFLQNCKSTSKLVIQGNIGNHMLQVVKF